MTAVSLSSQGLQNIEKIYTLETFTFVTNRLKYRIPRTIAVFLSPKVVDLLITDTSANSFKIDVDDHSNTFESILALGYGKTIIFNNENYQIIKKFAIALGNTELADMCDNYEAHKNISKPQDAKGVILLIKTKLPQSQDISEEIDYIARNFESFDRKELFNFGPDILNRILSHPKFDMPSEDSLFDFIYDIVIFQGTRYLPLFSNVKFEQISNSKIKLFSETFSYSQLNEQIWRSIVKRLVQNPLSIPHPKIPNRIAMRKAEEGTVSMDNGETTPDRAKTLDSPRSPRNRKGRSGFKKQFESYGDGNPHEGILAALHKIKAALTLAASSKNTGLLSQIIRPGNGTNFWTHSEANSWIRIDFRKHTVRLSGYSLRGRCDRDTSQLQTWIIEGIRQGRKEWEEIDSHKEKPLSPRTVSYFPISVDGQFKSIRLTQLGVNTYGDLDLVLSYLELYGETIRN